MTEIEREYYWNIKRIANALEKIALALAKDKLTDEIDEYILSCIENNIDPAKKESLEKFKEKK